MLDIFNKEVNHGDVVIKTSSNYGSAPILELAIYIQNSLYSSRHGHLIRKNSHNFYKLNITEVLTNLNKFKNYKDILEKTYRQQIKKPVKINLGTKVLMLPKREIEEYENYKNLYYNKLFFKPVQIETIDTHGHEPFYKVVSKDHYHYWCTRDEFIVLN